MRDGEEEGGGASKQASSIWFRRVLVGAQNHDKWLCKCLLRGQQWNKLPVEDIQSYPRAYLKAVLMQSSTDCCVWPTRTGVLDKMTS